MKIRLLTAAITYPVALGLILFSLRRLLFSVAALADSLLGRRKGNRRYSLPSVTLILPARDEESTIGETLKAIARLDYPRERLEVVMVDDHSGDRTPQIMKDCAKAYTNFHYLRTSSLHSLGKAAALNEALGAYRDGEIIYVFDADSMPEASCVRAAVQHFADDSVGAVTGAPYPSKSCSTFASYYAHLEQLVHQSVTTRAKDILGLAPPIFGSNCAYRRLALEKIGGFKDGALLEDSDLVLALYSAGFKIRFEPRAVSHLAMPKSLSSYVRQHARWTRGFNDVLGSRGLETVSRKNLPLPLRIELVLFASGYLDRVLLTAGLMLAAVDLLYRRVFGFPRWVLAASAFSPVLTIISALVICREPLARHWRLPLVPFFFAVDMASTLKGMVDSAADKPRNWHRVERESQVEL